MRVQSHNKFMCVNDVEATSVVVYDSFGNPIAVAAEQEPGVTIASVLGQPDFEEILENFGQRRTHVRVDDVEPQTLKVSR